MNENEKQDSTKVENEKKRKYDEAIAALKKNKPDDALLLATFLSVAQEDDESPDKAPTEEDTRQILEDSFNLTRKFNSTADPIAGRSLSGGVDAVFDQFLGTRYLMGGKGLGGIDCSGFVQRAASAAFSSMSNLSSTMKSSLFKAMAGTSETQFIELKKLADRYSPNADYEFNTGTANENKAALGNMLRGKFADGNFSGPITIHQDSGKTSWEGSRKYGIDHVMIAYRDPTDGNVYVAESRGSTGVTRTPLNQWIESMERSKKGQNYFAIDVGQLTSDMASSQELAATVTNTAKANTFKPLG